VAHHLPNMHKAPGSILAPPNKQTVLEEFFFFFVSTGTANSGLHLESLHQPFFVMGFFEIGSMTICPGLASNLDPPNLCLPRSSNYRCEPPVPGKRCLKKFY
jgi:hypothetical protein